MGPGGPGEPEELIDSPNGWFPARMVDFSRRRAWQKNLGASFQWYVVGIWAPASPPWAPKGPKGPRGTLQGDLYE